LRQAFELYVLHFPVYRTYITSNGPSDEDRALIRDTIEKARAEWFGADEGIFDFLQSVLTLDLADPARAAHGRPRIRRFAFKAQQFTGPMMAKSLEDTAFYRYHRLLALNEVGGDAAASNLATDAFHTTMQARAENLPYNMTATATHDTKRGEDARARILAISELAGEWTSLVGRWKAFNAQHIVVQGPLRAPSLALEYMVYQALLGAWPDRIDGDFVSRMKAYALKAAREAKLETSWLNPHEAYERDLGTFLDNILDPVRSPEFLESFGSFAERVSLLGALNSLSQLTLKTMMPGVPDFYQGTELWDYSLVDPDNRRPVNFAMREDIVARARDSDWRNLIASWPDGRIKLLWTRKLLAIRRESPNVFLRGNYQPLEVTGPHRNHVIAFARGHRKDAVIVAVARWLSPFTDAGRKWPLAAIGGAINIQDFCVDTTDETNTRGNQLSLEELFADMPVAVMRATLK
jgi:(1->4)-alpha-D-glucan 1-alpha-D-glucosylmutase